MDGNEIYFSDKLFDEVYSGMNKVIQAMDKEINELFEKQTELKNDILRDGMIVDNDESYEVDSPEFELDMTRIKISINLQALIDALNWQFCFIRHTNRKSYCDENLEAIKKYQEKLYLHVMSF